ncbi:hypothetical protein, partial [Escherichia coli]|uniref:hypothetical protein n=1 Tax=Escherichia coli TaxID=562 RepID=UPI003C73EE14
TGSGLTFFLAPFLGDGEVDDADDAPFLGESLPDCAESPLPASLCSSSSSGTSNKVDNFFLT